MCVEKINWFFFVVVLCENGSKYFGSYRCAVSDKHKSNNRTK